MRLAVDSNTVVLADNLANIPFGEFPRFDVVLRTASEKELQELTPDLVISLGGHIVSKRLKQFIRSASTCEQWFVSPTGEVVDTFQQVTEIIKTDPITFLQKLREEPTDDNAHFGHLSQVKRSFPLFQKHGKTLVQCNTAGGSYSDLSS